MRSAPRRGCAALGDREPARFLQGSEVDDRDVVGKPVGDVGEAAEDRHPFRIPADRNRGGDGERPRIDHRDGGGVLVGDEHPFAAGLDGDAVGGGPAGTVASTRPPPYRGP